MTRRFWRVGLWAGAAFLFLDTANARAWGPLTHVPLAARLLDDSAWLPACLAALLSRHAWCYLYGNIAADVVFAKRWSRVKQICHQWTTGFHLLDNAATEPDRAFSLGYLSHLAADTVAHGKYVPRQLAVTRTTMNFGHLYWEMRADQCAPASAFEGLRELERHDFSAHHRQLAGILTETFLPHGMNIRVFRRINHLVAARSWQRSIRLWGRHSRWALSVELLRLYHDESLARMRSVLVELHRSPVLHEDPNGTSALLHVRHDRRHMRRLRRRGLPLAHVLYEAAATYAPDLRCRSSTIPGRPAPDRRGVLPIIAGTRFAGAPQPFGDAPDGRR